MRNATYEQALTKQGVGWEYLESVPLSGVDIAKGLSNQARLGEALDSQLVEQYTAAVKDGSEFPPVVLSKPGRGRYVPLDGNQRLAAYKAAGRTSCDAYLVQSQDPMVLDRIAWSFNNKVNGKRLSYEECLAHAVTFVRKYGMVYEAAAKEWGVQKWAVGNEVRAADMRDKVAKCGVRSADKLSDDQLRALSPLASVGEDVLAAAAAAVASSGATVKDVYSLVSRVKAAKTQAAKLDEVETFAASEAVATRRAETKGGTVKLRTPLPRDRVRSILVELRNLLDKYPDRKAFLPTDKAKLKDLRSVAADVVCKLTTVYGLGTQLQEDAV